MSHEEEQLWIRRSQAGDHSAFASLVNSYWPCIQRWLQGLTQDPQAAEDLTQEAFFKAWSALASFTPGTNFRAWLFCIARHCLIDSRRCARPVSTRPLPDACADREPGPVRTLIGRETQTLVQEAVARLPVVFRAPFLLRTQEELSYQEIARVLDLTEETVRWRVFKARKLLLKALGNALDPDPS
ncbi:MAG: RNA polymerase sigma factor [Planctomycetes bacterium]|nr:RNA polymerase sigma factor [Planctomycetota bacterium]